MFSFISFVVVGAFLVGGGGFLLETKYVWQRKHEISIHIVLIDLRSTNLLFFLALKLQLNGDHRKRKMKTRMRD